jgi:hypothetical protein
VEAAALFIKIKADKGSLLDEGRELLTFLSPAVIVGKTYPSKKDQVTPFLFEARVLTRHTSF